MTTFSNAVNFHKCDQCTKNEDNLQKCMSMNVYSTFQSMLDWELNLCCCTGSSCMYKCVHVHNNWCPHLPLNPLVSQNLLLSPCRHTNLMRGSKATGNTPLSCQQKAQSSGWNMYMYSWCRLYWALPPFSVSVKARTQMVQSLAHPSGMFIEYHEPFVFTHHVW